MSNQLSRSQCRPDWRQVALSMITPSPSGMHWSRCARCRRWPMPEFSSPVRLWANTVREFGWTDRHRSQSVKRRISHMQTMGKDGGSAGMPSPSDPVDAGRERVVEPRCHGAGGIRWQRPKHPKDDNCDCEGGDCETLEPCETDPLGCLGRSFDVLCHANTSEEMIAFWRAGPISRGRRRRCRCRAQLAVAEATPMVDGMSMRLAASLTDDLRLWPQSSEYRHHDHGGDAWEGPDGQATTTRAGVPSDG